MLLTNKNAVIFGAGGAIDGAVARAFARAGAKVFLARGPHGARVVCLRSSGSPAAPGFLEAMKSHARAEGKPKERFQADLAKGALLGRLTKLTKAARSVERDT